MIEVGPPTEGETVRRVGPPDAEVDATPGLTAPAGAIDKASTARPIATASVALCLVTGRPHQSLPGPAISPPADRTVGACSRVRSGASRESQPCSKRGSHAPRPHRNSSPLIAKRPRADARRRPALRASSAAAPVLMAGDCSCRRRSRSEPPARVGRRRSAAAISPIRRRWPFYAACLPPGEGCGRCDFVCARRRRRGLSGWTGSAAVC